MEKEIDLIIERIKNGQPFNYVATLSKSIYTINVNERGDFILSNNKRKRKEILRGASIRTIIANLLSGD